MAELGTFGFVLFKDKSTVTERHCVLPDTSLRPGLYEPNDKNKIHLGVTNTQSVLADRQTTKESHDSSVQSNGVLPSTV